jgi:protein subunit release factor B
MVRFAVSDEKQRKLLERMALLGIRESDIEEHFITGSGKGGQKINKTASCAVLKHLPTGIVIRCQRERRLSVNRYLARRILADRIELLKTGRIAAADARALRIRRQKDRRKRRAQNKVLSF